MFKPILSFLRWSNEAKNSQYVKTQGNLAFSSYYCRKYALLLYCRIQLYCIEYVQSTITNTCYRISNRGRSGGAAGSVSASQLQGFDPELLLLSVRKFNMFLHVRR